MRADSIVFLNRFYWPDQAATAQQLTDLAEDLAAAGHQVTVIAGRGAYDGSTQPLPAQESRGGVRILRVAAGPSDRHNLLMRVLGYLSYAVAAAARLLRLKADVIVALTDPPLLHAVALAFAPLCRARVVYYAQDLYPDLAASLGVMRRDAATYRLARRVSAFLNRRTDVIVALGERMAERLVANGADPARTVVCPNWADTESIRPVPREENSFRVRHALDGRFVVQYSGNAGRAHIFDAVLTAAERLRARTDVVFLFIGGGKRRPELEAEAARRGLGNVRFLGYQPRAELSHSLSAADVSLVTESPDVVGMLVPSKAYGILAAARPLLFVGAAESDVAALVRETGAGYVIEPEQGERLAELIVRLADDVELRERFGRAARAAALTRYSRKTRTAAWRSEVLRVLRTDDAGEEELGSCAA